MKTRKTGRNWIIVLLLILVAAIAGYFLFTWNETTDPPPVANNEPVSPPPLSQSDPEPPAEPEAIPGIQDVRPETVSAEDDLIGRFLSRGGYRIVPGEGPDVDEALTAETFDDPEGELLTEELAEIYRSQGLMAEAREIYRKLSLLNPEKSIYFADAIARIETEKQQ